jgi:hypothetical protein
MTSVRAGCGAIPSAALSTLVTAARAPFGDPNSVTGIKAQM